MMLSIIIVNYNVTDFLKNSLESILASKTNFAYEVLVYDNNSSDESWKNLISIFPNVQFIASKTNDGFAVANNKAAKKAKGKYILLLNPDTLLENTQTLQKVVDFSENKKNIGCLGVRLVDGTGTFLPESKRSVPTISNSFIKLFLPFSTPKKKNYYRNDLNEFSIAPIEVITGAFFLCKTENYLSSGGLDETYFMYGEDIDLCYTFLRKGYTNYYYGKQTVVHFKGESTTKDSVYLQRFYGAMQIFIKKYYRERSPISYFFLYFGLKVRYELAKLSLGIKKLLANNR